MEEKFLLKENAFVGFLFRYAPVIFWGSIALTFLMNFVKIDIVDVILSTILFVGAIVWGVIALKNLNRQLLITDKALVVMKNCKRPIVLQQIAVDQVNRITESPNGDYIVEYSNGNAEVLSLAYVINPSKDLIFKVNVALEKVFGDRFDTQDKSDIKKYMETNTLHEYIISEEKSRKSQIGVAISLYIILAAIPTILGILQTLRFILLSILFVLKPFTGA